MPLNRTVLSGVLAGPPESKTISDRTVTTFELNFIEGFGENRTTSNVLVECWGRTAEQAMQLAPNAKIGVIGRIKLDRWEDTNTHKLIPRMKLLAADIETLGIATADEQPALSLNSCVLTGNLVANPEIKHVGDNRTTSYINSECWRRNAETVRRYLTKGSKIGVVGRLKLDRWEDRTTLQPRSMMKLIIDDFEFLGPRRGNEDSSAPNSEPPADRAESPRPATRAVTHDDEPPF